METIIKKVEANFLKEKINVPRVGDNVDIKIKIKEGEKERLQLYSGLVIAIKGVGINKSIKVRKIAHGVGVEKTILIHSPAIDSIEITREGKPRRAKLYYLRGRKGKLALKVKERVKARKISAKKTTKKNEENKTSKKESVEKSAENQPLESKEKKNENS